MKSRFALFALCIVILSTLSASQAAEDESFLDAFRRITGVTATSSNVRADYYFTKGDIWVAEVSDAGISEPRKITDDGTYHTPLWFSSNQSILAMKGHTLVRLNAQGENEETIHTLTDSTSLLGFDKTNPNLVLIIQESLAALLSLTDGEMTYFSYKKKNSEIPGELNGLISSSRDYGVAKVYVENQSVQALPSETQSTYKIHVTFGNKALPPISCPSACTHVALSMDGRLLMFIDQ